MPPEALCQIPKCRTWLYNVAIDYIIQSLPVPSVERAFNNGHHHSRNRICRNNGDQKLHFAFRSVFYAKILSRYLDKQRQNKQVLYFRASPEPAPNGAFRGKTAGYDTVFVGIAKILLQASIFALGIKNVNPTI